VGKVRGACRWLDGSRCLGETVVIREVGGLQSNQARERLRPKRRGNFRGQHFIKKVDARLSVAGCNSRAVKTYGDDPAEWKLLEGEWTASGAEKLPCQQRN